MKRAGTWGLLAAATTLSALIGFGCLEWLVRNREAHRSEAPGTMPFLYYRSYRVGHALVRGIDYYGWVHINRQGFRGPDVAPTPAPGVTRIMVVGSSTTMDGAVSRDENAWPARLQHWLNQLQGSRTFEVINAGTPGYRVIDNVIRFQLELYRYQPHLVILYEGHNDLLAALSARSEPEGPRPGEIPTRTPWTRWLEQHSLLYNKVVLRWQAIRGRARGAKRQEAAAPGAFEEALSSGTVQFEHDLRGFLALTSAAGIPVVIPQLVFMGGPTLTSQDSASAWATWRAAVPVAPPNQLFAGYARFDSVARAEADAYHAVYIPTRDFGMGAPELYAEGDPVHFSDRGADRMGQMLSRDLIALSPWR